MNERTCDTTPLPHEPYYEPPAPASPPAPQPRAARRVGIALIIVGLLWLLATLPGAGIGFWGGTTTLLNQTYSANTLVMNVDSADVEVRSWSDSGIHVQATQRGSSRDDVDVNVDYSGDMLRISDSHAGWFNWFGARDVKYTVLVSNEAQVQIETTSGDIDMSGVEGRTGANASVVLRSVSGDITAGGMAYGLTASTTNGDLQVNGVSGVLALESTNGDISVSEADAAQLTVNSTNSSFTFSGSFAPGSQNQIEAVNGDIELRLPSDSDFRLHATTVGGDLSLDDSFEAQRSQESRTVLDATVGNGTTSLNVQTVNGDIEIKQQ